MELQASVRKTHLKVFIAKGSLSLLTQILYTLTLEWGKFLESKN